MQAVIYVGFIMVHVVLHKMVIVVVECSLITKNIMHYNVKVQQKLSEREDQIGME